MPQLASLENCTGCSACANACVHNAITMKEDSEGFLFPVINDTNCVECRLCEKVCPVVSSNIKFSTESPDVYAMWSMLDRTLSSSGGVFSAFARFVISKGGVVFGAAYDENLCLVHTEASTIEGLKPLRESKYMQSKIGITFCNVRKYLQDSRFVLFCGTPCQIAGLKQFLGKEYDKLLLLDLACHGVPANKIFQNYLKKLEIRLSLKHKIQKYSFRRCKGWGFLSSVANDERVTHIYGIDNLYMEAFNASAMFRKCCYSCKYSTMPRVGDCSIADFWGIGRHGTPFKSDVMDGVSLVLVNTIKGDKYIHQLKDVFIERRQLDEALIENPNLCNPSPMHPQRNEIIAAFLNPDMSLDEIDKKYKLVDHSVKAMVKKIVSKYGLFKPVKRIYNWAKAK